MITTDHADRVLTSARSNFLRGKDYDPGDYLPAGYIEEAIAELHPCPRRGELETLRAMIAAVTS